MVVEIPRRYLIALAKTGINFYDKFESGSDTQVTGFKPAFQPVGLSIFWPVPQQTDGKPPLLRWIRNLWTVTIHSPRVYIPAGGNEKTRGPVPAILDITGILVLNLIFLIFVGSCFKWMWINQPASLCLAQMLKGKAKTDHWQRTADTIWAEREIYCMPV